MATAATFPRSAPMRARFPLLALAWFSVLTAVLAPADTGHARSARATSNAVVPSPAIAGVRRAPALEAEIDAALPAIHERPTEPAQAAQPASVRIVAPTPTEAAALTAALATPEAVRIVATPERQTQQFAVTASLPVADVSDSPAPAAAATAATTASTAVAAPSPAALVASTPPAPPPAFSGREQRLFEAINAQRKLAGVPPLLANATLTQAARSRSQDMVTNSYFAHIGPRGQSWYTALAAVGWSMSGGGENLAKVAGDERTSVADAVDRLMASPTHRANIVSQSFRLVGVGAVVDAAGITIFTTIFTDR